MEKITIYRLKSNSERTLTAINRPLRLNGEITTYKQLLNANTFYGKRTGIMSENGKQFFGLVYLGDHTKCLQCSKAVFDAVEFVGKEEDEIELTQSEKQYLKDKVFSF